MSTLPYSQTYPKKSATKLTPITSPWPFYKWGINIAGPFPEGPGKVKFLIVAIDYLTKWIEANPVATIHAIKSKKIIRDNIVCRFRLPGEIISDNGKQFRDNPFKVVSPPTFCFCKTSARKWVSRKSKSKLRGRDQGKAKCKKQDGWNKITHVLWHKPTN
ncbi:reverse transcriptase domain-containing protein [Tanacetum coccineum]